MPIMETASAVMPSIEIVIKSDDAVTALKAAEELERYGFSQPRIDVTADCGDRIGVDPGPLGASDEGDILVVRLLAAAGLVATQNGVDEGRYPARVISSGAELPTVFLPVTGSRTGAIHPYAGAFPDRFVIGLFTDDEHASGSLARDLKSRGFTRIIRRQLDDLASGFRIEYGGAKSEPAVVDDMRDIVAEYMKAIGGDGFPLHVLDAASDESCDIGIYAPVAALLDGSLERELSNPLNYGVAVFGGSAGSSGAVSDALRAIGFATCDMKSKTGGRSPRLQYGGAPKKLVQRIRDAIEEATGLRLPLRNTGPVTDRDIAVVLPEESQQHATGESRLRRLPSESVTRRQKAKSGDRGREFIEIYRDFIMVGDQRLSRCDGEDNPFVPRFGGDDPCCMDGTSARIMLHLAVAIALGEPVALEGPTGAAKTRMIQQLAALLNRSLLRINLNGATDPGELLGRYVPTDGGGWRFQEGPLVTAMRNGCLVLLDEINLAAPQVVECLNSVLERDPSLVLTAHDNSKVEVHPDFRIFCTMNPVDEYAGRQAMSPAFRDRWQGYLVVNKPDESEVQALAHLYVFGEQPSITVNGQNYVGGKIDPVFPRLAKIPDIETFLRSFSRFHASVDAASDPMDGAAAGLGANRQEAICFTRRGFLNVLRFMEIGLGGTSGEKERFRIGWKAIDRYYLRKLSSANDRAAVVELARAAGITKTAWRRRP